MCVVTEQYFTLHAVLHQVIIATWDNVIVNQQTQNICITFVQMLYKCFVFAG